MGNGCSIALNHKDWFSPKLTPSQLQQLGLNAVSDLINHETKIWNSQLLNQVYEFAEAISISYIPLSKKDKDNTQWACFKWVSL